MSAALYVIVGIGVLARTPRDARALTFFTISIASVAPYMLPATMARLGTGVLMASATVVTIVSLAVGSVALFHFTQVFPERRPWIRVHGFWLTVAYGTLPMGAAVGAWAALPIVRMMSGLSAQAAAAEAAGTGVVLDAFGPIGALQAVILLVVLIPTIFLVGVVLPFAALLSLYKSWQDAKKERRDGARVTTLTILISQLAGGVLTILVVPLLHLAAPTGPWVTIAATLLFGFGLLFPIAFAIGVWKYRLIVST